MTASEQWELRVAVDGAGEIEVTTTAPAEVARWAGRVVRIAVRSARGDERPLPRVLQRWRDRDPGC